MDDFVLPWGLDYCKCGNIKRIGIDLLCVDCREIGKRREKIKKIKTKIEKL